jgi:hypothetical protein
VSERLTTIEVTHDVIREGPADRAALDRVAALLERVDYKPGHRWYVRREQDVVLVYLEARVPNAYYPKQLITRVSYHAFPDVLFEHALTPEEFFFGGLRSLIREFELHEADEFFKVDGKALYDPHLEPAERPKL